MQDLYVLAGTGTANQAALWVGPSSLFGDTGFTFDSSTDIATLTGGLNVSALTSGSVLFAGTSGALSQNNSAFNWDNTNQGLTITNTVATNATKPAFTIAYPASVGGTGPTALRINRSGSPYDYDIYVRGGYYSSTWMVLSGHATNLGTTSFEILTPTSDSNVLGIWSDVNSAAVQIRCNTASSPNRALDVVDASTGAVYLFSILPSGALSWGNGTFAAQDTTIAWNSANNLLLTGSMTASVQFVTNGSVSAPGFSFTGRLTDGMYDTGSAVGIAVGGVNQLLIATSALSCPGTITPGGQIIGILGSASTPSYGFTGRSGDGILDDGSGVNISVGGTVQMYVRSGQIYTTTILTVGNVGDANLKRTGTKALQILDDSSASIGFFATTPAARTSAYTQTYSSTTRTHASFTSGDLTGITSSTTGTALAEPSGSYTQSEMQQNFRRIQDQFVNLRADLANLKDLVNSIIDDQQTYGLFQ